MKYMARKDLEKKVKRREKEGIICLPTSYGIYFYNPKDGSRKDISCKKMGG